MSTEDEDRALRAGEYVLGVLDAAERARLEEAARRDPELARAIHAWEERLTPLTRLVPPSPPPAAVWARIEARLFSAAPASHETAIPLPLWRRLRRWQAATAAGFAIAAALLAWTVISPLERQAHPPAPIALGTLAPSQGQGPLLAAVLERNGTLLVASPAPMPPPAGRSYELWILPQGARTPRSLGVMPESGRRVAEVGTGVREAQVMISLEPRGGSPSGLPTGPVVYAGQISALE